MPVTIRLNDIQIATPCRADWNKMQVQEKTAPCAIANRARKTFITFQ